MTASRWLALAATALATGCFDAPPAPPTSDVPNDLARLDVAADGPLDGAPDAVTLDASPADALDAAADGTLDDIRDAAIDQPPPACAAGLLRCAGDCIDVAANTTHCGRCGNTCLATQTCRDGACIEDAPCAAGQQRCRGTCVATGADPVQCGACGNACPEGRSCLHGACVARPTCEVGLTACGGLCVDTAHDPGHCGACGNVCPPGQSCTAGACRVTTPCALGLSACGGRCVNLAIDLANCGVCGRVCSAGQACEDGACRMMDCPSGRLRCGANCIATDTDSANCGMCGRACAAGQTCSAGECAGATTCPTGQSRCGEACSDPRSDPANCGTCGRACTAGQACAAGVCVPARTCPTGETDCAPTAPTASCANLATSNSHCGACGNACPAGLTCTAGVCACATGRALCGRACIDPQTDGRHCGGCGRACASGQTCQAGSCRCPTGRALCNGACVDPQSDESHCGACGAVCAGGQSCQAGRCACPAGWSSCGEGASARCVDLRVDRASCGACGRACPADQGCVASACACPTGQTTCGDRCVDLLSSASHCGACGRACPAGVACRAGACMGSPPGNDTRAGATTIDLGPATQTLSADTTGARNDTRGTCGCTNGNDVFFRFTLSQPEVVYADTLAASWDTALFFQDAAGANISGAAGEVTCNDDLAAAGLCPRAGAQSQVVARLAAGTWYLVLSGCGVGPARVAFQHLPAGSGPSTRIAPNATVQTAMGTAAGAGTVTGSCCTAGAEASHWWLTCPDAAALPFHATSCSATTGLNQTGYDNALVQYSALRNAAAVEVCNDDTDGVCGNGATVATTIPATGNAQAGLNVLVADACAGGGPYTVQYVLAGCANGARCGNACVETSADPNHCGGCNRRCATGNTCVAGACVAPPANDLPTAAVTIDMTRPQSTFTFDARGATQQTVGPCGCTAGRDVFFNFTVPASGPEIVYADTLGSNWDTSLFVQTSAGVNVTSPNLPLYGVACNDDGGLDGCATGLQSQVLLVLNPGAYRLVASGCGAGGSTSLRFQHLPVGNGPLAFLPAGSSTPGGTTSGVGRVNAGCNAGGPEQTFYWFTCPAQTTTATFTASTCGRATWDTSLVQYSPGRITPGATVCNDDACPAAAPRQSSVTATIPAGAGLHALYVDGFGVSAGPFTVSVVRP